MVSLAIKSGIMLLLMLLFLWAMTHDMTTTLRPAAPSPATFATATIATKLQKLEPANGMAVHHRTSLDSTVVNIFLIASNAKTGSSLYRKFMVLLSSLCGNTKAPLAFYVAVDGASRSALAALIGQHCPTVQVTELFDVASLINRSMAGVTTPKLLPQKGYYAQSLFFLAPLLHRALAVSGPTHFVALDADILVRGDIAELAQLFDNFSPTQVMGLAHEQQPVYYHLLQVYRNKEPASKAGLLAAAGGFPGFNSGVILLDLARMRASELYNSVFQTDLLAALTAKYTFKGHLGDQDLYTMLGLSHPELFYTLPCEWNKQLCHYWFREQLYPQLMAEWTVCGVDSVIRIVHGNCGTPIPTRIS